MTMADDSRLDVLMKNYDWTSTPGLYEEGITQGDRKVKRYLKKHLVNYEIPSDNFPEELVEAATFFSAAAMLRVLNSDRENKVQTVVDWENDAEESLDAFIADYNDKQNKTERGVNIGFGVVGGDHISVDDVPELDVKFRSNKK